MGDGFSQIMVSCLAPVSLSNKKVNVRAKTRARDIALHVTD